MKKWKRMTAMLLCVVCLLSVFAPALAAETAATMRLEKTTGTVTVANNSGKQLKEREGMRLYNGYGVATKKASYAYISLDGSKAAKLDASSALTLGKVGRKLELKLTSGKMFFDVDLPLEKNESMNIRTSTMVTGIRGTAGWVVVLDQFHSRLYLLEGKVTVSCTDPATGLIQTETIVGGESILSTLIPTGVDQVEQQRLVKESYTEDDVPGFVRQEIAEDPELEQRLRENSPLDVDKLLDKPEERLKADQQAAEDLDKQIQEEAAKQKTEKIDPVFKPKTPSGGGGGGGTPPPPVVVSKSLDDPLLADVQAALNDPGINPVNVTNANLTQGNMDPAASDKQNLYVPDTKTLNINSGTVNIYADKPVVIDGTMNVAQGVAVNNQGRVDINSPSSLHLMGTMINEGTINIGGGGKSGLLEIASGAKLANSGSIHVGEGGQNGTMTVAQGAQVENMKGTIIIRPGSTVTDNRENLSLSQLGNLDNQGTLTTKGLVIDQSYTHKGGTLGGNMTVQAPFIMEGGTITGDFVTANNFTIKNGTVQGNVTLNGTSNQKAVMENGTITGDVSMTGSGDPNAANELLVNGGTITGTVTLNDDVVLNVETGGTVGKIVTNRSSNTGKAAQVNLKTGAVVTGDVDAGGGGIFGVSGVQVGGSFNLTGRGAGERANVSINGNNQFDSLVLNEFALATVEENAALTANVRINGSPDAKSISELTANAGSTINGNVYLLGSDTEYAHIYLNGTSNQKPAKVQLNGTLTASGTHALISTANAAITVSSPDPAVVVDGCAEATIMGTDVINSGTGEALWMKDASVIVNGGRESALLRSEQGTAVTALGTSEIPEQGVDFATRIEGYTGGIAASANSKLGRCEVYPFGSPANPDYVALDMDTTEPGAGFVYVKLFFPGKFILTTPSDPLNPVIDWTNPNNELIAKKGWKQFSVETMDTYGIQVSTEENGYNMVQVMH